MSLNGGTSRLTVWSTNGKHMSAKHRRKTDNLNILFAVICVVFCVFIILIISKFVNEVKKPPTPITTESQRFISKEKATTESLIYTEFSVVDESEPEPIQPELPYYYDVPLDHDLQDYIRTMCNIYEVPMSLVIAMIDRESTFRQDVISSTNDYGLMQINAINHEWLSGIFGFEDFLDPYNNVLSGIYIISGHLEATDGDIELALMRYNCGASGAKRLWDDGVFSTLYTRNILNLYYTYEESRLSAGTP